MKSPFPATNDAERRESPLFGRVVVITGASSGIGRATARAFARHGARLVLTARNIDTLRETAAECTHAGAHALVESADVTDAGEMAEVARKAIDAFGGIDIWVNNAGVGLFGSFMEAGVAAHRRVVETNLFGAMNGAAAVLPQFLRQQRGVLITNISIGAFVPVPFAAAYTAGKFGMRGFMAALRQELVAHPAIRVCSVFPSVIDTPGFEHGANVSGTTLTPSSPIFPPEAVASAIVRAALDPRDEIPVGWPAHLARWAYGVAPATTERLVGRAFRAYVRHGTPERQTLGNLFEPSSGTMTASGGWRERRRPARQRVGRQVLLAGVAGLALIAGLAVARRRRFLHAPGVRDRMLLPMSV